MKQLTTQQSELLEMAGVLPEDIAALQRLDLVEVYIERLDKLALARHHLRVMCREFMELRDQYNKVSDELEYAVLHFNGNTDSALVFDPIASHPIMLVRRER